MIPAHRALRDGTRAAHEALDGLFARFDLADRGGYARFLSAHAEALLPIEAALDAIRVDHVIDDWQARRRGAPLRADLAAIAAGVPTPTPFPLDDDPAAIAGTLYVIEGSRLGGRLLARQVGDNLPTSYLDPAQPSGAWRKLLATIDATLYDEAGTARAVTAANAVFARFAASGRSWLAAELE